VIQEQLHHKNSRDNDKLFTINCDLCRRRTVQIGPDRKTIDRAMRALGWMLQKNGDGCRCTRCRKKRGVPWGAWRKRCNEC